MPMTSQPRLMAPSVAARMTPLRPGASPPPVLIAMRFIAESLRVTCPRTSAKRLAVRRVSFPERSCTRQLCGRRWTVPLWRGETDAARQDHGRAAARLTVARALRSPDAAVYQPDLLR